VADAEEPEPEPAIGLLDGWRRELAGEVALSWLRGDAWLGASADAGGVRLHSRP
jgi:hypothetical protein